jgi:hypothetical protein
VEVIDLKKTVTKVNFADMPIGQTYRDDKGVLCIKTAHDDDDYGLNCIFLTDKGNWDCEYEAPDSICELVTATLTVEG